MPKAKSPSSNAGFLRATEAKAQAKAVKLAARIAKATGASKSKS